MICIYVCLTGIPSAAGDMYNMSMCDSQATNKIKNNYLCYLTEVKRQNLSLIDRKSSP